MMDVTINPCFWHNDYHRVYYNYMRPRPNYWAQGRSWNICRQEVDVSCCNGKIMEED